MQEYADAPSERAGHGNLERAEERNLEPSELARRVRGELARAIVCHREDRADDVGARDAIAIDDRLEQLARGAPDLLGCIALDGRRAANGSRSPVTHDAPACWILIR